MNPGGQADVNDLADNLPCVVLAGGRSSRMKLHKALVELHDKPLLQRVLERLPPEVTRIAVNTNAEASLYRQFNHPLLKDRIGGFRGPLAGIHAGMAWAQAYHPSALHILSVATDTPFFPLDLAPRLMAVLDGDIGTIAIPRTETGRHRAFGLFPVALMTDLQDFLLQGESRVNDWLQRHEVRYADFEPLRRNGKSLDPFFNINTPEDLQKASDWLR